MITWTPPPLNKHQTGRARLIICPLRKDCVVCQITFGRKVNNQGYFESKTRFDKTDCCSPKCFEENAKNKKAQKAESDRRVALALAQFNLGGPA